MAGGRDIRRATRRIREEQRKRNAEARAKKEARLADLERRREMSPAEIRREDEKRRAARRQAALIERDGHRVLGSGVKGRFSVGPNKLDAGGGSEDKGGLDAIAFGSKRAKEIAVEEGLTLSDFMNSDVAPTGSDGYLTGEVRRIAEERGG